MVVSLLHDITETIAAKNHGEAVAGILAPFVGPDAAWLLRHHEVFQGHYYFHHFGGDRNARDKLLAHDATGVYWGELGAADRPPPRKAAGAAAAAGATAEAIAAKTAAEAEDAALARALARSALERRWNATARWCHLYDQASFDPSYASEPLAHFEPLLRRVLGRAPYWWDPTHPKRAAVTG